MFASKASKLSHQAAELINIDPVQEETQIVPQRTMQDHLE